MKDLPALIERAYEDRLSKLFQDFFVASTYDWDAAMRILTHSLRNAKKSRDALLALGMSVVIVFKENRMTGGCKLQIKPTKRGQRGAVQPGVKWSTLTAGIELQLVYEDGTPVSGVDSAALTVDLSVDDTTKVTVNPGADNLHWSLSKAGGTTGDVTLTANVTFIAGSPGPFQAVLPIELDAATPTDVVIVISGN